MLDWANESLKLLNQGRFRITDPGPLHVPIHQLTIRRDDTLALQLETEAAADARSSAVRHPLGTVRKNVDQVELHDSDGVKATLIGVQPYRLETSRHDTNLRALTERATVHQLTITTRGPKSAAYTIECLENLAHYPFIWPDCVRVNGETALPDRIALEDDGITLCDADSRESMSFSAVKLIVAGTTIYVCALDKRDFTQAIKPGCIVYLGTPDNSLRKKIRTALAFALGVYLIEVGHTLYDPDWRVVSTTACRGYSLDRRAFDLPPMPLAPLSRSRYRYHLERAPLTKMVNALVASYDAMDLANLSWAYWHARVATVHTAPAQFGAAIEAVHRAYVGAHPKTIATKLLATEAWKQLQTAMRDLIVHINASEQIKADLLGNLSSLNRVPLRTILKAVLHALDIDLSVGEDDAWKRRNDSAHGLPTPEGSELAAIRDTKLLQMLLHRMLLRFCHAADTYVDYVSLDHPYRPLKQPPSS